MLHSSLCSLVFQVKWCHILKLIPETESVNPFLNIHFYLQNLSLYQFSDEKHA